MADLRQALGEDVLLTMASASTPHYVDFKKVVGYLDFVNVMTYDLGVPPYHHLALYRSPIVDQTSVEEAILAHHAAGVPYNKLVMGIPFYGRGRAPLKDFVDYRTIVEQDGLVEKWDEVAQALYRVDSQGQFVVGYDNPRSIRIKCQYILDQKLLGAMFWDYSGYDSSRALSKALYQTL